MNFYEQLGVASGASDDAIRSAYRTLARKYHPDLHGQSSPQVQAANSRKMAEISEAYEVLSDPRTRAAYDRELDGYQSSNSSHSSSRPPPPQWPRPNADQCEFCGSGPAASVRLRRNVGLIFTRRRFGGEVIVCRSCGLALFRQFQNSTLAKGWWGPISFFINFGCVLGNAVAWLLIATLDEPSPPTSPVDVPLSHPMPKGPILLRRAGVWVAVMLFFVLANNLGGGAQQAPTEVLPPFSVGTTPTTMVVHTPVTPDPVSGECVAMHDGVIDQIVDCATPHYALIVKVTAVKGQCLGEANEFTFGDLGTNETPMYVCFRTDR